MFHLVNTTFFIARMSFIRYLVLLMYNKKKIMHKVGPEIVFTIEVHYLIYLQLCKHVLQNFLILDHVILCFCIKIYLQYNKFTIPFVLYVKTKSNSIKKNYSRYRCDCIVLVVSMPIYNLLT